jgi:hypothetical protein
VWGTLDQTRARNELHNLGIFLAAYRASEGRLPPKVDDLIADIQREAPRAAQALKAGELVYVPNVQPSGIVIYEHYADRAGHRLVLRTDGSVEMLDAQRFQAALKGQ